MSPNVTGVGSAPRVKTPGATSMKPSAAVTSSEMFRHRSEDCDSERDGADIEASAEGAVGLFDA
jgi:hypothetical protein